MERPSGSGKSSLLRCVGGLQTPSAGTIKFGELDITKIEEDDLVNIRRQTVGFVFQSPTLISHLSAEKNVMQTLRYSGKTRTEAIARTDELMSLLGIKHRAYDLPSRLSGGERQRVGIAGQKNPTFMDEGKCRASCGVFGKLAKTIE